MTTVVPNSLIYVCLGMFVLQMFFDDDLPVWGFIGKTENKPAADGKPHARQYLFTHFHFDIGFNGNQVRLGCIGTAAGQV